MAEATDITFTLIEPTGFYKRALVTAEASATETITLDDPELYVNEIVSVRAHVAATGVAVVYAYATNVLTRTTAGTDVEDVIEILYK